MEGKAKRKEREDGRGEADDTHTQDGSLSIYHYHCRPQ